MRHVLGRHAMVFAVGRTVGRGLEAGDDRCHVLLADHDYCGYPRESQSSVGNAKEGVIRAMEFVDKRAGD